MLSVCHLCTITVVHHKPKLAEMKKMRGVEREREREIVRGCKEEETSVCLKTLSGKYLAPKLISLFDQKKATERFELKKLNGCETLALVKTQETITLQSMTNILPAL